MANANVTVDYNDERFKNVESDKAAAMSDVNNTYDPMINQSDKFYDAQIDASKDWADKQSELQQERSDFAIEQIEQQKEQAKKDYLKEQTGAYTDWQKESNKYGAGAEEMASQGLGKSGYSESSQVNLYNTYQKRVASARESYRQAVLSYDNAIKDARLQNNSALAEIAYNALKEQLALGLEGFQYKNSLILEKANRKTELDNMYYGRYQDVLQQINTENAMAEEIRQFNKSYELDVKKYNEDVRQFNKSHQLEIDKYNEQIRQFDEEIAELKKQNKHDNEMDIANLELARDELVLARDKLENVSQSSSGDGGDGLIVKGPDTGNLDEFPSPISNIFKGVAGVGETVKNAVYGGADSGKGGEKPSYSGGNYEPTPNMASILALGYGPISAEKLNSLVISGKVEEYEKDGQLYYRKK